MELLVKRDVKAVLGTMGYLFLDGTKAGVTLELPIKDGLPGSAIPAGRYEVKLYDSPHFGRLMPLLIVPGRSEIEIHWGSDVSDTRGCILVGTVRDEVVFEIYQTRKKFEELFPAIEHAVETDGCWITVTEEFPTPGW